MKLSEIEGRIEALEKALLNKQPCPADPCHVHYAYDVTQENWEVGYTNRDGILVKSTTPENTKCVCREPDTWMLGKQYWPQRRVLIAHAPEMYRLLARLSSDGGTDAVWQDAVNLLALIKKELQENA